jgi:hypothetical protein
MRLVFGLGFRRSRVAIPDIGCHFCDLVAVTLGATRDAAAVAEGTMRVLSAQFSAIRVRMELRAAEAS